MPIQKKNCSKDPNGEDIYLFTLTNQSGTTVSITNYGAIIASFKIKTKEGINDIVLGFDRVDRWWCFRHRRQIRSVGGGGDG